MSIHFKLNTYHLSFLANCVERASLASVFGRSAASQYCRVAVGNVSEEEKVEAGADEQGEG